MTRCNTPDCPHPGVWADSEDGGWRCPYHQQWRGPLTPAERCAIEEGLDQWPYLTDAERQRWGLDTMRRLLDALEPAQ